MPSAEQHRYLVALGSNQRHPRIGQPRNVIPAAIEALENEGIRQLFVAPIVESLPIGPSDRRFCNCCILVETRHKPEELLQATKGVERAFGRRAGGQSWRARVLDIDIILWSGGIWASSSLQIPHPRFRDRDFVLGPAKAIARDWRDPITGLSVRQLFARLTKARPDTR
ncbi:MAG TPA: 2-amino-4-hydroxy-6-hydroxymethyldihydropteridine diphosphokinase [Erythrobacter sp.]|nr:2-amino-4-hydroxy-6-hydroxymethyldihydropteridine diphosphokinase [Erythrobacter sp.]